MSPEELPDLFADHRCIMSFSFIRSVLVVDDIGNFMATSLMGTCTENQNGGCPLGSLTYRGDFEPTATGCFGPGGSYRMAQLSSVWIFLAHNAGDEALDFMVRIACVLI